MELTKMHWISITITKFPIYRDVLTMKTNLKSQWCISHCSHSPMQVYEVFVHAGIRDLDPSVASFHQISVLDLQWFRQEKESQEYCGEVVMPRCGRGTSFPTTAYLGRADRIVTSQPGSAREVTGKQSSRCHVPQEVSRVCYSSSRGGPVSSSLTTQEKKR